MRLRAHDVESVLSQPPKEHTSVGLKRGGPLGGSRVRQFGGYQSFNDVDGRI
ncbi:hypothetical protein KIN20_019976 [Parelaphostrongylus tenuis]|uniref:Uncharacterized protein n=1 Tax=Parelaphostrongylus tenuis TaxID=148309 RepID=A0AAD5MQF7_PARTN|nr:hypothetical protein KIN20_019976 [Parelaphostrongylus tenuis]